MPHGPFSQPGTIAQSKTVIRASELRKCRSDEEVIEYFAQHGIQFIYDEEQLDSPPDEPGYEIVSSSP
jgi:hypothetical protein